MIILRRIGNTEGDYDFIDEARRGQIDALAREIIAGAKHQFELAGLHFVGSPGGPCGLFGRSFDAMCQIWLAVQGRAEALLNIAAQQQLLMVR